MKQKFLVVIEKGDKNYSAYSPDILGCATTGKTVEKTLANMKEALEFHFEGMIDSGEEIPAPKGLSHYLQTDEISSEDLIAHVEVELPEFVAA